MKRFFESLLKLSIYAGIFLALSLYLILGLEKIGLLEEAQSTYLLRINNFILILDVFLIFVFHKSEEAVDGDWRE